MYFGKRLFAMVLVVGLVGCGTTVADNPTRTIPAGGATHRSTAPIPPVTTTAKAGAGPAAERFYALYAASEFTASWQLLTPTTRQLVPSSVWAAVHNACVADGAKGTRVIKAITIFGNAAIVTTAMGQSKDRTAEDVFSYIDGHWDYSPEFLNVYQHKSVTADVAAARAKGLCAGWRAFLCVH
jgi:hypothetical protein